MKISVIIPTYKPQGYLWECLDSLATQTFPKKDFEVILVLNGCKEPYENNIRTWFAEHPDLQVNFIQTDQGGVSSARNIALGVAQGEYITFIDDDDYVSPSYLEELYAKASPNTISLSNVKAFMNDNPNEFIPYYMTDVYKYCVTHEIQIITSKARRLFNGPWMKLIPTSFIQGRRFNTNFKIGEDAIYMFLISDKYKRLSFTSPSAVYYRRFRSMSASFKNRSRKERICNNCRMMIEFTRIFFSGRYNFYLYSSRMAAAFIDMFR